MIYGNIQQWTQDSLWLPECFDKAMAFCGRNDVANMAPGRYDIEGNNLYALVQGAGTDFAANRRFELHREYADLQVVLRGRETQFYAPAPSLSGCTLLEDRLAAADIAFYAAPANCQTVLLEPGHYAAYLPEELHCPCCTAEGDVPGSVRKVVFKIRKASYILRRSA